MSYSDYTCSFYGKKIVSRVKISKKMYALRYGLLDYCKSAHYNSNNNNNNNNNILFT